ncbi:hypothetical protein DEH80_14915 [Abyssibacter profundi]|uniref:Sensor domain-containing diguanylate cyclase n=2 Tax=Abyssibacter profundi TaxID=2182787 RepID=A0A383XQH9_9GAMM|nr:hypothetical protein DEH80_14915 [Abyssibacter profundi]
MLLAAERLAGLGHWRLDLLSDDLFWSDEIFRIHGYEPNEIIPDLEFGINAYHPEDRDKVSAVVERAISEQVGWTFQVRLIHRDGGIRHVRAKGEVETDAAGHVVALFGVFQDCTVEVEERIRLEQLNDIVESTHEGVVVTDAVGVTQWCNEGFAKITGYSREELIGRKPGDLLQGPATSLDAVSELREAIQRGQSFTGELLNYDKAGRAYWVRISMRPITDEGGEVTGFHAIESDITASRQITEDLRCEVKRREALENRLRRLATEDPLSGLLNRRGFFERAEAERERARRQCSPLHAAVLDIDYFKKINDQYGHDVGDQAIRHVSGLMKLCSREYDLTARIGGEEFAFLLQVGSESQAEAFLQRFLAKLRSAPLMVDDVAVDVRCSVGMAVMSPGGSIRDVMTRADRALYEAKRRGRDRLVAEWQKWPSANDSIARTFQAS